MGYTDIKQQIVNTLMNREAGTQIQPQNHQEFALSLLEYIRQVELISGSTLIGIAYRTTVPVQSDKAFECYLSACLSGESITFENFHGQDGSALTFTAEGASAYLLLLTWNKEYWECTAIPTSVSTTEIYQATGDSETATMSQKAITEMLNKKPTIADGEDADLDVADDGGNVIARFKEGHIQTKEFNSKQVKQDIKSLEEQQQILRDGVGYYVCNSEGSEVHKVVTGVSDTHLQGVSQKVKMMHATTTTLSSQYRFGENGVAHPIRYNGKPANKNNSWADGEILEIWCDGQYAYAKPWQGGAIDPTLEVEGASADAKATGDRLKALEDKDVSQLMEWGDNPDLIIKDKNGNEIAELNDGEIKTPHFDSRKQPQINDDSEADLDIGDENGNSVVRFKDGHLRTQLFDSSKATTKVRINIVGTTGNYQFERDGQTLSFKDLNELLQESPHFCVFVHNSREHRCVKIVLEGNPKSMTFLAPTIDGVYVKAQSFKVISTDGVNISSISRTDIVDENRSNKVNDLDNPNETTYPTTQAVANAVADKPIIRDGEDAELDIGDEEGNAIARFQGGEFRTQKFDSANTPKQADDNSESNLDVADEEGNAIVRFKGGEIQTKNFNSAETPKQTDNEETDADLLVADEQGKAIVEFKGGHIRTKEFNSRQVPSQEGDDDADLNITDPEGNVIMQLKDGHIKTKNFNSRNDGGTSARVERTEDGRNVLVFTSGAVVRDGKLYI